MPLVDASFRFPWNGERTGALTDVPGAAACLQWRSLADLLDLEGAGLPWPPLPRRSAGGSGGRAKRCCEVPGDLLDRGRREVAVSVEPFGERLAIQEQVSAERLGPQEREVSLGEAQGALDRGALVAGTIEYGADGGDLAISVGSAVLRSLDGWRFDDA